MKWLLSLLWEIYYLGVLRASEILCKKTDTRLPDEPILFISAFK